MLLAFIVTLLAGLATSIGGLLATHRKVLDRSVFAVMLAFAAGAMLFVSFVEILPHGLGEHGDTHEGSSYMEWIVYAAFFFGVILVALIDRFLPSSLNPSVIEGDEGALDHPSNHTRALARSGILVAVVLSLHNFPEGMSTFLATYEDPSVGITLAVAIAIHNIPEGIAVAAPIYAATKSRKKAFMWATISGLTEPLGALVGVLLIGLLVPAEFMGAIFGLVAGMMVFVAIDELLPAARRYQTRTHQVVYGLLAGMGVVALSLLIM